MSNSLPATLGIAIMLMASPTLANDVSVPGGGNVAEWLKIPSLIWPTDYFVKMPPGPFTWLQINGADAPPPIPSGESKWEMLVRDVDSFNLRAAQWGANPMEAAMKGEIATVGGPAREGDTIDFAVLNQEGRSRIPLADPPTKTREMFSIETVGLPVPFLSRF